MIIQKLMKTKQEQKKIVKNLNGVINHFVKKNLNILLKIQMLNV